MADLCRSTKSQVLTYPMRRDAGVLGPGVLRMLGLVLSLTREKGRSPTSRELAAAYGCSQTCAISTVRRLRKAGLVEWEDGKFGTLRPTCRVEVVAAAPGERKVRRG